MDARRPDPAAEPNPAAGSPDKASGMNDATKTLLLAAAFFLLGLALRFRFPDHILARGLLFCAEAALVGGVADWFAVTALFERPLGFPWHTAILPRRRPEFMAAAANLIQREFFSRRQMFSLLERYNWRETLVEKVRDERFRTWLRQKIAGWVRGQLRTVDTGGLAQRLAAHIRQEMLAAPLPRLLTWLEDHLRAEDNDRQLLARGADYLYRKLDTPETAALIQGILEDLKEKKLEEKGFLARIAAAYAEGKGILDLGQMASLIQREFLRVLEEIAEPGSKLQDTVRGLFYHHLALCGQDEKALEAFGTIRGELLRGLPLEEVLAENLRRLQEELVREDGEAGPLARALRELIDHEIQRLLSLLDSDEQLQQQVDQLIYDIVARSALQAQIMSGQVARVVMVRMTDDDLNHIVRDKIEPDLIWIRMNGSIVGAIIGAGLFAVLEILRWFI